VLSTVLLLVIYGVVTISAQAFAGVGDKGSGLANADNSGDVLSGLGGAVFGTTGFGWFLSKLLVLMVLTSASASTQTTIMPTARTALSMGSHGAIPRGFARVHPRFRTPSWSTIAMGIASVAFYAALTKISGNVLSDSISSLGLAIAFYYGLTGIACFWHYLPQVRAARRTGNGGVQRKLWLYCVLPLLGGLILWTFFGYACHIFWDPTYGTTHWDMPFAPHWSIGGVFLTGIGALVVGIPLMYIYRFVRPAYFRGEVLRKESRTGSEGPVADEAAVTG